MQPTTLTGLKGWLNFLGKIPSKTLQNEAVGLQLKIRECLKQAPSVPCRTSLSQQYHLKQRDSFYLLDLPGKIKAQHFVSYGSEGHQLTSFIGTHNIPEFVKTGLIAHIEQIPEFALLQSDSALHWNLTFNTYEATKEDPSTLSGFKFHTDVASNGQITLIYSLGATSLFQIVDPRYPSYIHSAPLTSDSLILLSGEARWNCLHRVAPIPIRAHQPLDPRIASIHRISLVLGARGLRERS